jgi:hypothetical protein
MTTEWTVLITVAQVDSQPPITGEQSDRILAALGWENGWVQYPPASGRGHGFETRWWQPGDDAAAVAVAAAQRFGKAGAEAGLEFTTVLVHVATAEDRLNETTIGVDRRAQEPEAAGSWNVMLRAVAGSESTRSFPRSSLDQLLEALPGGESSGFGRDGMVEVRFWVEAIDAVDAAERGSRTLRAALADLGHEDWTIVRSHVTSVAEAVRTAYRGVERRVLAGDPGSLPIAIRAQP